jgi:hypothetical protein
LQLASDTEAIGYLLYSEALNGWVDGYYDLAFIRSATRSAKAVTSAKAVSLKPALVKAAKPAKKAKCAVNNFKVQAKHKVVSVKQALNTSPIL